MRRRELRAPSRIRSASSRAWRYACAAPGAPARRHRARSMMGCDKENAFRRQETRASAALHERPSDAEPIDRAVHDRGVGPRHERGLRFRQQHRRHNGSPTDENILRPNPSMQGAAARMGSSAARRPGRWRRPVLLALPLFSRVVRRHGPCVRSGGVALGERRLRSSVRSSRRSSFWLLTGAAPSRPGGFARATWSAIGAVPTDFVPSGAAILRRAVSGR